MAYSDARDADGASRYRTRNIDSRLATIEDDLDSGAIGGGTGGGAPTSASYVVIGANAGLSAERVITGSSTISVADGGANGNVTLSVADASITTAKMGGDVTTAGKALLTAADAAAQRTALGTADEALDTATLVVGAHELAADPHPGYQLEAQKGAANGYASLDAGTKVPIGQLPTGSSSTTVCVGNDARLSDARTPTAHVHAAADITSGTIATARLGSGTANATTFLRGDGTWAAPAGGSGASLEASILTSTQANSTVTPATLTGCTFTIPPGKKAVIIANLIATAAATTTGIALGVKVTQPTGADGNATGSCVAHAAVTSAAGAGSLYDGDGFNVAGNSNTTVETLATATTSGNQAASMQTVIHNRSTNVSTTVEVVFRSEVGGSAVTAQIGSGATCAISG